MFALRGIAVSLTLFWLSYCLASAAVGLFWRYLDSLRNLPPRLFANLLFAVRIVPLAFSVAGTLAFAAPSFVWLEPHSADEEIGIVPLILGACCLAFLVIAVVRVVLAQVDTSRIVARWLRGARALDVGTAAPTFQTPSGIPPFTLAGVCRPRLLLSESALGVLSPEELQSAVRHEMAHMRFRDNLKKLAFRFAWFPGLQKLEKAWQHAAELAADDAAVGSAGEALDLAAALIKLSRQAQSQPLPAISVGLLDDGFLTIRISRLLDWKETSSHRAHRFRWIAILTAVVILVATAAVYVPLLSQTHALTEWLVR